MKGYGSNLVKEIFLDIYENKKMYWAKTIQTYLRKINMNIHRLPEINTINKEIKKIDSLIWKEQMQQKQTLTKLLFVVN